MHLTHGPSGLHQLRDLLSTEWPVSVVSGGIRRYALPRPAVFDISQDLRVLFCVDEFIVQEQAQFADLVNFILLDGVNTRLDLSFGLVAWRGRRQNLCDKMR